MKVLTQIHVTNIDLPLNPMKYNFSSINAVCLHSVNQNSCDKFDI